MGEPRAWASAITALLADPARCDRMAEAGVAKLKRDFTEEGWLRRITGIYDGILGK